MNSCILGSMSDLAMNGPLLENISERTLKEHIIRTESHHYTTNTRFECDFTWRIQHFTTHFCDEKRTVLKTSFSAGENTCKWVLELHMPFKEDYHSLLRLSTIKSELGKFGSITGQLQYSIINSEGQKVQTRTGHFQLDSSNSVYDTNSGWYRSLFFDNKLLPQNVLTLHCSVSYIHSNNSVHIIDEYNVSVVNASSYYPLKDFAALLNNEEFSDITIYVNDKKYMAHKNILATQSSVFKAMFTDDMKEKQQNRIDICDIDEKIFQEILRYIYTGKVKNIETIAFELLLAADKYDLVILKALCENALCKLLGAGTALKILSFSDKYCLQNLKSRAINYISTNMKEIRDSEEWNNLISQPDFMKTLLEAYMK